ncbi:MAG: ANTAR domain-containing protein [Clostridia bacterium]|nr:ANTAR domain-containing protein [Clostridia bacterium]
METVVIVSASEKTRDQLFWALSACGIRVYQCCKTESGLRHILAQGGEGLAIVAGRVPAGLIEGLLWDYGDRLRLLVLSSDAPAYSQDPDRLCYMPLPVSARQVADAVAAMLRQSGFSGALGKRRENVEAAKAILMRRRGMTEPEAHHFLQQYAMNHGEKMADVADALLRRYGE